CYTERSAEWCNSWWNVGIPILHIVCTAYHGINIRHMEIRPGFKLQVHLDTQIKIEKIIDRCFELSYIQ
ncbi:MAG: hypothetical protein AABY78_04945, partial [Nitrospirota bacterium]